MASSAVASGADRHQRPRAAPLQQVADRVDRQLVRQQVVGLQPVVVEELAQVVAAGVADDADHHVVSRQPAGVAQGRRHAGAAGAARQDALAPGQLAGDVERLGVADAHPLIDQLAVERPGHEVLADALDLPRLRRAARQHAALRVGPDDLDVRVAFLQIAAHAGERAAGADAGHEGGDAALGLVPDFRAGGAVMNLRIGEIGELVGPPGAGDLAGQAVGDAVVAVRRVGRHVGRRDDDLGAVGLEQQDFLARHLVGQHEDAAIALDGGDQGQADAGVAGRGLDDGAARPQPAALLGLVDHRQADTILDAAAGVHRLDLDADRGRHVGRQPPQPHQRRPADRLQDAVVHRRFLSFRGRARG